MHGQDPGKVENVNDPRNSGIDENGRWSAQELDDFFPVRCTFVHRLINFGKGFLQLYLRKFSVPAGRLTREQEPDPKIGAKSGIDKAAY